MKLKDHFTDSISTAGGASLSQMADKGEAFKVGLDGSFTCIVLSEAPVCGPLFWKTARTFVFNPSENPAEPDAGAVRRFDLK